ncbi:unnamed protein product [Adineta steineri]|uniref:RRM domain-containing protein n=1 Tax=Adineta steineri TaxID=433720 RepID=A0A818I2U6_9BILA|nr:unnamed protein product [Adineta steineri]
MTQFGLTDSASHLNHILPIPHTPSYLSRHPIYPKASPEISTRSYNPIFPSYWQKSSDNYAVKTRDYHCATYTYLGPEWFKAPPKDFAKYKEPLHPSGANSNNNRPFTAANQRSRSTDDWSKCFDDYPGRFKIAYASDDDVNDLCFKNNLVHYDSSVTHRPSRYAFQTDREPNYLAAGIPGRIEPVVNPFQQSEAKHTTIGTPTSWYPYVFTSSSSSSSLLLSSSMSLHKDTTFTKIFVGGLPYHTTDDTLRKFFERFGEIEEAVVITDRQTGKSRGYGFVTMNTQEAASLATKEANPVIDGRKANVNLAYLGAKPRVIPSPAGLIPLHLAGAYSAALPTTYGIQPIYYQQPPTTTLLATAGTPQTLSTLIPNQTTASLNGAHSSQNQSTGGPSYYELTYATAPLTSASIEQQSYIYATASGQTFSYAQLPTGATQQQTGPTNLNDVYANHAAKYMIDDHNGAVDRDHHQRTAAGW